MREKEFSFVGLKEVFNMFCTIILIIGVIQLVLAIPEIVSGGSLYGGVFHYVTVSIYLGLYASLLFIPLIYFVMEKGKVKILEDEDTLTLEYSFKSVACKCTPQILEISKGDLLNIEVYTRKAHTNSPFEVPFAKKVKYEITSGNKRLDWTTPPVLTKKNNEFTKFLTQDLKIVNGDNGTYRF
ncbi:hypothetical protein RZE82_07935 [Mollicutes bacterium LVI A0039]|nr:hypothetical protein RZE82_07935 [Mollicutes bacterium LVI A0039]